MTIRSKDKHKNFLIKNTINHPMLFLFSALVHAVMSFRALGASKQVEELHKAVSLHYSQTANSSRQPIPHTYSQQASALPLYRNADVC